MMSGSHNLFAVLLLCVMGALMFFSVQQESATMDESLHITAGYSYFSEQDYRLNREHPPLSKDIAALPVYFLLHPTFPTEIKEWTEYVNDQWPISLAFLYRSGNDPDAILRVARLPIIVLTLCSGWLLFRWVLNHYGKQEAIITLFLFSFSPTFIAHGRYVTTDVAASFGYFVAIVAYLRFLPNPGWSTAIVAGTALAIALLTKVSALALIPLFLLYAMLWFLFDRKQIGKVFVFSIVAAVIAVVLVWIVYTIHLQNYPVERQIEDTKLILSRFRFPALVDIAVMLTPNALTRPFAHYLLATLMALHNFSIQGPSYFLGDVSTDGWWYYFPVAFLFKEPFPVLILMITGFSCALWRVLRTQRKASMHWIRENFITAAIIIFIVFYWALALRTKLSIGIRHMLPTYPFLYTLIALYTAPVLSRVARGPSKIAIVALLAWLAFGTIAAYPYYLSYYNELAGGTWNGYRFMTDSNYDWGQDLRRLAKYVKDQNIHKIGLDYFGGGSPEYYLGSRYIRWSSERGEPDVKRGDPEWIAVSITTLQNALGRPIGDWSIQPDQRYDWLRGATPAARAGTSIFIYRFETPSSAPSSP